MFHLAIGAILGFLYANIVEWAIHKYLLHQLATKKAFRPILGFHWYRHHKQSRRNNFLDPDYQVTWTWDSRTKEVLGLIVIALVHMPVAWLSLPAYCAMLVHLVAYYLVHWKSHVDPEWAKKYVPWHYDHHMGRNQNANYNVTYPLADWIFGTRE